MVEQGPVDYINQLTQQLHDKLSNLDDDIKAEIRDKGHYVIALGPEEGDDYARIGINSEGIDWMYLDETTRAILDSWTETATDAEAQLLHKDFVDTQARILKELGYDHTENAANIGLYLVANPNVRNLIFTIQVKETFNWDNVDGDLLEETLRKIIAIYVIGYSFFENTFN